MGYYCEGCRHRNIEIHFLQAVLKAHRWIPVSERLPEEGCYVLVTSGKYVTTDRYYGDESLGFTWQGESPYHKHTHWKPIILPEAK